MEQPDAKQVREYLHAIVLALARLEALALHDEERELNRTARRALRAIAEIVNRDERVENEERRDKNRGRESADGVEGGGQQSGD